MCTTQYNKQITVNQVPFQPSAVKITYDDLRGWVGNILINKSAFVLKQRYMNQSTTYLLRAVQKCPITDMFWTTALAVLQFPEHYTIHGL
jgi:hypothetical protein